MIIGEVVGRLWASRQAGTLAGQKLLLVRPLVAPSGRAVAAGERLVVAVDGLSAGPGDRVIVAHGTRVRDITVGETVADKDVVVAIVDDLAIFEGGPSEGPPAPPRQTSLGGAQLRPRDDRRGRP